MYKSVVSIRKQIYLALVPLLGAMTTFILLFINFMRIPMKGIVFRAVLWLFITSLPVMFLAAFGSEAFYHGNTTLGWVLWWLGMYVWGFSFVLVQRVLITKYNQSLDQVTRY